MEQGQQHRRSIAKMARCYRLRPRRVKLALLEILLLMSAANIPEIQEIIGGSNIVPRRDATHVQSKT
jgi:hypothetical protein